MRVVHLTSAHSRFDTRIFRKMCNSSVEAGYSVSQIVADGKGNQTSESGVSIVDVGRPRGRLDRMFGATRKVRDAALALNADLYHLHDPELIPIGLTLKRRGKRVVFDFHEDVPKQLLSKPYLNPVVSRLLSWIFARYEAWAVTKFDAIIGATPTITKKFSDRVRRAENINNFPQLGELESSLPWDGKANEIAYVGGISAIRGIVELVEAVENTKSRARLNLVGDFGDSDSERRAKNQIGWEQVNPVGFLDRAGVRDILARSVAGMVTFLPLPNHVDAQPNKMFEYMSAGIPVIASDFPLWREIIVGYDCGICVDPQDPAAIAAAIDTLLSDRARAEQLGRNGRAAVQAVFNWSREKEKLLQLYKEILA
ncbi:MAG: glycosyltransferase [Sphingopyxis sp.]|uniref:glycosyltransferase n=1 Tax=Sphingopyxis sp. TaxID=1908224 RepID=UPI002AB8B9F2|nr:glycosyltransferase [Sphingopyxis sp.]MDZ3831671.1 glycosyltransferase [Sphingopyxis sp.]